MWLQLGFGGWCEVGGVGLPGRVYARFGAVDGQARIVELYVDGQGEPIQSGALRKFPLAAIEQPLADEKDGRRERCMNTYGPDLSRLASSYTTAFGRGSFKGRHCPECEAPLRGSSNVAQTDWVVLSRFAQMAPEEVPQHFEARLIQELVEEPPEPKLTAPEHGLTDAFLADVGRAYGAAVARRQPPATTLAKLAGVDRRTVESWVYKARKRGIMAPAVTKGRIV